METARNFLDGSLVAFGFFYPFDDALFFRVPFSPLFARNLDVCGLGGRNTGILSSSGLACVAFFLGNRWFAFLICVASVHSLVMGSAFYISMFSFPHDACFGGCLNYYDMRASVFECAGVPEILSSN